MVVLENNFKNDQIETSGSNSQQLYLKYMEIISVYVITKQLSLQKSG